MMWVSALGLWLSLGSGFCCRAPVLGSVVWLCVQGRIGQSRFQDAWSLPGDLNVALTSGVCQVMVIGSNATPTGTNKFECGDMKN